MCMNMNNEECIFTFPSVSSAATLTVEWYHIIWFLSLAMVANGHKLSWINDGNPSEWCRTSISWHTMQLLCHAASQFVSAFHFHFDRWTGMHCTHHRCLSLHKLQYVNNLSLSLCNSFRWLAIHCTILVQKNICVTIHAYVGNIFFACCPFCIFCFFFLFPVKVNNLAFVHPIRTNSIKITRIIL